MKFKNYILPIFVLFTFNHYLSAQITPTINGVVFVNKAVIGGNASGNSWANAVPELADVLLAAHTNTNIQQIWVAQGIYAPKYSAGTDGIDPWLHFGTPTSGPAASFVLVNNVKLYGGFQNATETNINQRDTVNNNTILTGDSVFRHVVMSIGPVGSAELNGFTITKGLAAPVQPFYVNATSTRSSFGAGLYMDNTSLTVNNCLITNNQGECGAGIYANNSSLVLQYSSVTGNHAIAGDGVNNQSSSSAMGGGIYFKDGSALTIDHSNISDNSATATKGHVLGAGLNVSQNNNSMVNISNSTFNNNTIGLTLAAGTWSLYSMVKGAGLYLLTSTMTSIDNCVFSNNSATLSAANTILPNSQRTVVEGGGIFNGSPLVISNSIIKNNQVAASVNMANNPLGWSCGAGIMSDGAALNGVPGGAGSGVNITINNCIIENNAVTGNFNPSGGGIDYRIDLYLNPVAVKPKINNSIIRNNSAPRGGAIHTFTLAPIVKNTLFENNIASEGIVAYNEGPQKSAIKFTNCTFVRNSGKVATANLFANADSLATEVKNCIIANNEGGFSNGPTTAEYSLIEGNGLYPGIGNINQNPQFTDANIGDYSLMNSSPAANTGNNSDYSAIGNISNDTDLAGNTRLFSNRIDMGAYESQSTRVDTTNNINARNRQKNNLKIFPNPSKTGAELLVKLDISITELKGGKISIINIVGQTISTENILKDQMTLKTPNTPGNYLVSVQLPDGSSFGKPITVY